MKIRLAVPFSLMLTCRSHGWVNLSPFEWDPIEHELRWTTRSQGEIVSLIVHQPNSKGLVIRGEKFELPDHLDAMVRYVFMLDWDAGSALEIAREQDPRIAVLVEEGGGRLLRGSTPFEDVIKTICTINTSWSNTRTMVKSLVNGIGCGVFPTPEGILSAGEKVLRRDARVGYRAGTIMEIARLAMHQNLGAIGLEELNSIKGLGPYAIDHLRILRGDYSRIPVDSEVREYCKHRFSMTEPSYAAIQAQFSGWGRYRYLGYKFGRIVAAQNWLGD